MRSAYAVVASALTVLAAVACSSEARDDDPRLPSSVDAQADGGVASQGDGGGVTEDHHVPVFSELTETCKLISGLGNLDPSGNDPQHHANIQGTDLGIPVVHDRTLYVFFGDTIGYKGIWAGGQSNPDAVGFAISAVPELSKDVSKLCKELRFLTVPSDMAVGPKQDARIEGDFAGATMAPPPGEQLSKYIHNPGGRGAFPFLPGDFEVPSGAFSYDGSIYLFYTTVAGPNDVTMKASYVAKWKKPSSIDLPVYDILYPFDERFDDKGPLHGDFINVSTAVSGEFVYLFGTGQYRRSPIHLARKKLSTMAQPGGVERFDAKTAEWVAADAEGVAPIVETAGYGETSVVFYPELNRWAMIAQEELPTSNRIVARFAEKPEGPWSPGMILADLGDPAFRQQYCCKTADRCEGPQLFHCEKAGFYAPYFLPWADKLENGKFALSFLMSTWDPYNVALMRATFE